MCVPVQEQALEIAGTTRSDIPLLFLANTRGVLDTVGFSMNREFNFLQRDVIQIAGAE